MIRVFPRRTQWTPDDGLAFIGDPPLFRPPDQSVMVSVAFTWDRNEGERLFWAWSRYYKEVNLGGPAYEDPGGEFIPGRFLKLGVTITSRGCLRDCPWCFVPQREGTLRELPIRDGWIIEDNNLLACSQSHIEKVFEMLSRQPRPASFNGGLDARLFSAFHANLLNQIKFSEIWFSCDTPAMFRHIKRIADLVPDISARKKRCYVLIGYNGESIRQAESRLEEIYSEGFWPFAMLYRDKENELKWSRDWQRLQRRWCRPAGFKTHMKSKSISFP